MHVDRHGQSTVLRPLKPSCTLQIEVAAIHSPIGKLARIFRITRIFTAELLGSFTIVPYGTHAMHDSVLAARNMAGDFYLRLFTWSSLPEMLTYLLIDYRLRLRATDQHLLLAQV